MSTKKISIGCFVIFVMCVISLSFFNKNKNLEGNDLDFLRQGYVASAHSWMAIAEKGKTNRDVSSDVSVAQEHAKAAGTTLAKLGYSEKFVHETLRQGYVASAHSWMAIAEKGKTNREVSSDVSVAQEHAKAAGTTLAKLGYSENFVHETLRQGYVASAHSWMAIAEKGKTNRDVSSDVSVAQEHANAAGTTLAKLGYSENFVHETLRQGYVASAHSWMAIAEKGKTNRDVSSDVSVAQEHAKAAGTTLAKLGYKD